jgi:hypothetical protein
MSDILHDVFDLWVQQWSRRHAPGELMMIGWRPC